MLYFVVDKSNCSVKMCSGKKDLIVHIATYNCKIGKEKRNLFLENVAMNNNDKKRKYDFYCCKNTLISRKYIIFDQLGRIIDPRFYESEILNFNVKELKPVKNINSNNNQMTELSNTKIEVNSIARCGNKFRPYFRSAKTANEKRNNAIPEYKQFIRGRRKVSHISPAFDDYFVHTEKNWKRLKIRKQYLKNV